MGGTKEVSMTFCSSASLPARAGCPTVMFTAFWLPLLGSAAMERKKGAAFSQKDPTSVPHGPGHCVRAAGQLSPSVHSLRLADPVAIVPVSFPSCSSACVNMPTFSCTSESDPQVYLFVEQGVLCWVIVAWLINLRRETGEFFYWTCACIMPRYCLNNSSQINI